MRRCTAAVGLTSASLPLRRDGKRIETASGCEFGDQRRSLLDRPWFILCLLFFVTAILGLPLLWISRGFSLAWKIALSVVVTLYTALLLWGFWWIMSWSVSRIMDSLS